MSPSSRKESSFLLLLLTTSLLLVAATTTKPSAPALYVFGDSLFDSGNNNLLPTLARANYLPYGVDFVKGPTGRFSNGRTVADFIAEYLGLPYAPPYLSGSAANVAGINYASGSCGILPETGNILGKCLNLNEQISLFGSTVTKKLSRQLNGTDALISHLSKSIFIVSIGSNDYINNYLQPQFYNTSNRYPPREFAQLLVNSLKERLHRLYDIGARKVIMFEIGPIGCIPSLTRTHKHDGQCVEEFNKLVIYFNDLLPTMLNNLTSTLPGSMFVDGHAHWIGYDAVTNPKKYGLVDSVNPCCKAWFNGTAGCIPLSSPCRNVDQHYFWDAYHLTQSVYSVIATRCFNGTDVCSPMNIEQLVGV
ncbi:unnamed protein product [Rhodiola kirilowii]